VALVFEEGLAKFVLRVVEQSRLVVLYCLIVAAQDALLAVGRLSSREAISAGHLRGFNFAAESQPEHSRRIQKRLIRGCRSRRVCRALQ
jgi:hypothetical protein